MIEYLIELDTDIFLFLNSKHALFWDIVMKMATGKIIWVPMYAALLFALWRAYGWKTALLSGVLAALAVTAADQMTASVLRPYFERMRPSNPNNPISELVHIVDGYRGGRFGFPSCHAANTFAVVVLMSLIFNRWKFTAFILFWALLNCYSRLYLGVHYPGDLLAGIIIGSMCGAATYLLGSVVARVLKLQELRRTDSPRLLVINGWRISYRPSDIVILFGVLTIVYIVICAISILY